jgi:hypothetical protein
MTNLHVESLTYKIETDEGLSYYQPPPLDISNQQWDGRLEKDTLTCKMKISLPTADDARKVVDPFLRAWEIDVSLKLNRRSSIRFIYVDAKIVDLDPPQNGSITIYPQGILSSVKFGMPKISITMHKYPEPPYNFIVSPDVEKLWYRYGMYLDRKEPLITMAYFCLTFIENKYGKGEKGKLKRKHTADTLKINLKVLNKLGELTSIRGSTETARKITSENVLSPLIGKEIRWIETLLKIIIYRLGQDVSSIASIEMKDLPALHD